MQLLESVKTHDLPKTKILGSDIDTNILAKAQRALYPEKRMNDIDEDIFTQYFIKKADTITISPMVKRLVSFQEVNLADKSIWPKNNFDIIFCRNVLIYMAKEYKIKIIKGFNEKLKPGGYLFLGYSETLHGIDVPLFFKGHSIFRKENIP